MASFQDLADFPPELQAFTGSIKVFDNMMEVESLKAFSSLNQINAANYKKDMYSLWDTLEFRDLYQELWDVICHVMVSCISIYDPNKLNQLPSEDWRLEQFKYFIKQHLALFKEYLSQIRSKSPKFNGSEEQSDRFANRLISRIESMDSSGSKLVYLMAKEVQRLVAEW